MINDEACLEQVAAALLGTGACIVIHIAAGLETGRPDKNMRRVPPMPRDGDLTESQVLQE